MKLRAGKTAEGSDVVSSRVRLRDYFSYLAAKRFVEVEGGLFAVSRGQPKPGPSQSDSRPVCYRENENNKESFDLIVRPDADEEWRLNNILASAIAVEWSEIVASQFPGKDVLIRVVNRLVLEEFCESSEEGVYRIIPTLRMWARSDASRDLELLFRTDDATPDHVTALSGGPTPLLDRLAVAQLIRNNDREALTALGGSTITRF